jgi:hypothetical protein
MQSKDLRIGNLVEIYKERQLVVINYIDSELSLLSFEGFDLWDLDKTYPVLLTEKWLINLGFELKEDEGDVKYYEKNTIGIKMDECLDFYLYIKSYNSNSYFLIKQLEVVHELQNLYFALTCEELELKHESKP